MIRTTKAARNAPEVGDLWQIGGITYWVASLRDGDDPSYHVLMVEAARDVDVRGEARRMHVEKAWFLHRTDAVYRGREEEKASHE